MVSEQTVVSIVPPWARCRPLMPSVTAHAAGSKVAPPSTETLAKAVPVTRQGPVLDFTNAQPISCVFFVCVQTGFPLVVRSPAVAVAALMDESAKHTMVVAWCCHLQSCTIIGFRTTNLKTWLTHIHASRAAACTKDVQLQ